MIPPGDARRIGLVPTIQAMIDEAAFHQWLCDMRELRDANPDPDPRLTLDQQAP